MVVARRVTVARLQVALLAVVLSGCLGAGPGPDDSTPEPTPGPDVGGPRAWTLRLEGCKGFDAFFEAPRSAVRAEVPKGLRPYGDTPSTAGIAFRALRCDRAANESRVHENVSLAQFFVRVSLENRSWGNEVTLNMYGLDSFAAPPAFADSVGVLRVVPLESSAFDGEALDGTAGASVQRWKFVGRNTSIEFEFEATGQRAGGFRSTEQFWFGLSNLSRLDRSWDYRHDYALVQAGAFRVSGPSRIASIMGSSVIPHQGQAIAFDQEAWLVNETWYRG